VIQLESDVSDIIIAFRCFSRVIVLVIVNSQRHVNDDSLLSIMFHVAELILELDMEADSDWSRWTLQEQEY